MTERPKPPRTIVVSVVLMVVGVALATTLNLIRIAGGGGFDVPGAVGMILGLITGFLLIRAIWRGWKWVRMFLTVVAAFAAVVGIVFAATGLGRITWAELISQVIGIVPVVLLWVPSSRAFFDAATLARRSAEAAEPADDPEAWKPPFS